MSRYRRNPDGTFDKIAGSPYMPPNFIGASPSENGEAGLVPAPLAGDESKVLYGDGSWRTPPSGELNGSGVTFPENASGKYLKDDGSFDNVKNNTYGPSSVDRNTSIRSTDQVTIDPEVNDKLEEGYFDHTINLSAIYSLFKDMLTNVWQSDYTEAQTYGDFVEALYSEYDRIELWLHTTNLDLYGEGNEYSVTVKMVGEYGKVNPAYPDTDYWKFQGTVHPNDNDDYGFNGFDTLKMTIYVNPIDPELPDDLIIAVDYPDTDNPVRYETASDDDICTNVFDVEMYNQNDYEDNGHFIYWIGSLDNTSKSFEFVGIKTEEVYPTPTKYLREDGAWAELPKSSVVASLTADGVLTYGDIFNTLFTQVGSFNSNKEYLLAWYASDTSYIHHATTVATNSAYFSRSDNGTNNTHVVTAVVSSYSKLSEAVIDSNGYTYNNTTNDVPASGIIFFIKEIPTV